MRKLSDISDTIWLCDFEFQLDGHKQLPLCMVASEVFTGKTIFLWRDQLSTCPFPQDKDYCLVAYSAAAELVCFKELGWTMPPKVLDLMVCHKEVYNVCNERQPKGVVQRTFWNIIGTSLVDALRANGLNHIMAGTKQVMIDKILYTKFENFTEQDKIDILDYCHSDVIALEALLPKMLPRIHNVNFHLKYCGEFLKAISVVEANGIPFQTDVYRDIVKYLPQVRTKLVESTSVGFLYETKILRKKNGTIDTKITLKSDRLETWIKKEGWEWEQTEKTGKPVTDKDYLKKKADTDPRLRELHELTGAMNLIRGLDKRALLPINDDAMVYAPSSDGMIRCGLRPFGTNTGRNAPRASQFIFGNARWVRGLMAPKGGYSIAYLDWKSQEIGLAAGLSGDQAMIAAYESVDGIYLDMAKRVGKVPIDGTKDTHPEQRNTFKVVTLAMGYGQQPRAIAIDTNVPLSVAREIFDFHKKTFHVFWSWVDNEVMAAYARGYIQTQFGWRMQVNNRSNPLSIMNFQMQSNGAHCMHLATIAAIENNIHVCGTVHDAVLIQAPTSEIAEAVRITKNIMLETAQAVSHGVQIGVDVKIINYPDHFRDGRGEAMFQKILGIINDEKQQIKVL